VASNLIQVKVHALAATYLDKMHNLTRKMAVEEVSAAIFILGLWCLKISGEIPAKLENPY
jgi:hypothetical protein